MTHVLDWHKDCFLIYKGKKMPKNKTMKNKKNKDLNSLLWKKIGFIFFFLFVLCPLNLNAAPEFQEYSEGTASSGNSVSVNKPSGTQEGDLLIACYTTDGSHTLSAPDSSWTLLVGGRGNSSDNTPSFGVWYKIATASENSSYTFDCGRNESHYVVLLRYTGHDSSSPINASAIANSTGSYYPTAPTITTTIDDCIILRVFGADDDDTPYSVPSGYTERYNGVSSTGYGTCGGAGADAVQSSAGSTGTAFFTTNASEEWMAATIAIAPPPKPTVSVTVTPNSVKAVSAGEVEFKLIFDQSMNTAIEPVVTYDPEGSTGLQQCTSGTWSTTNLTNDTYIAYNDSAIDISTGDGTAAINVSGAQSSAGITMDADTDDTFYIDATVPVTPSVPCNAWDTVSKTNTITDDSWQKDYDSLYLEWSGASDGGSGIAGYSVYFGENPSGEPGLSVEQSGTSYDAGNVASEGSYYFRLRTFDNAGNYTDALTLFTFKYDAGAPATVPVSPCDAWNTSSN